MPNSVGEKEGEEKASVGRTNRRDKWVFRRADEKVCDDVCLCRCEWSFPLLHGLIFIYSRFTRLLRLPVDLPQRGNLRQSYFPEVAWSSG